jgi:hypothetical protein
MAYILSNYGHRWLQHLKRSGGLDPGRQDVALGCLLLEQGTLSEDAGPAPGDLVARGLAERADLDAEAAALRYARNPLEHLRRVVFEYTNVCNFDCLHCRNRALDAQAEAQPEALRRVVDAVLPIGIDRFDFIGGEVTLYGKGWLELVEYVRAQGGTHASVMTSGWFLEGKGFGAAGRRYADDAAYLGELRERGLTHVIFSLDGPEPIHDACRRTPGLYRRVIRGFDKVRAAGLTPRVSLVWGMSLNSTEWIADISERLYGPQTNLEATLARLLTDDSNYVSRFIDVGGGVQLRGEGFSLSAIDDDMLRCRNFFRPAPTLRIKATGEISLCSLLEAGDGYGDVRERDPVYLLNHLQDAFVYKLHAERRIADYRSFLDPHLFSGFVHVCSARVALNMVARAMHQRGVSPDDREAIRAVNVEVAGKMGILPRKIAHRANGHGRRPAGSYASNM